jgi:hypothetical protein
MGFFISGQDCVAFSRASGGESSPLLTCEAGPEEAVCELPPAEELASPGSS